MTGKRSSAQRSEDERAASESPDPRRLRWSVPKADVSTSRWLDTQADISRSLRTLIRESIQREGYIDVDNRPVEQLPRLAQLFDHLDVANTGPVSRPSGVGEPGGQAAIRNAKNEVRPQSWGQAVPETETGSDAAPGANPRRATAPPSAERPKNSGTTAGITEMLDITR